MKTILLVLLAFTSNAAFAAKFINVTMEPKIVTGVCTYDAAMPFNTFPDYEIFSEYMNQNWLTKQNNLVSAYVEVVRDINTIKYTGKYILHLSHQSEQIMPGVKCSAKYLRVMIR